MPMLSKIPPSSLRNDSETGGQIAESRPYLLAHGCRRAETTGNGVRTLAMESAVTLFAHESEDARLTGSTRSLYRRLLALNLPAGLMEANEAKPATGTTFPERSVSVSA